MFFGLEGMTCAVCSGTIESTLNNLGGVYTAKVSLMSEVAEVVFDPRKLTGEQICEEIEDVGFGAEIKHNDVKGKAGVEVDRVLPPDERERVQNFTLALKGVIRCELRVKEREAKDSATGKKKND